MVEQEVATLCGWCGRPSTLGLWRGGEEAGHSGAFPRAARAEEVAGRGIL